MKLDTVAVSWRWSWCRNLIGRQRLFCRLAHKQSTVSHVSSYLNLTSFITSPVSSVLSYFQSSLFPSIRCEAAAKASSSLEADIVVEIFSSIILFRRRVTLNTRTLRLCGDCYTRFNENSFHLWSHRRNTRIRITLLELYEHNS